MVRGFTMVLWLVAMHHAQTMALSCRGKNREDKYNNLCESKCKKLTDVKMPEKCPPNCECRTAAEVCSLPATLENGPIYIKENTTAGTVIFKIDIFDQETWTATLKRADKIEGSVWDELQKYFHLAKIGQTYQFILDRTPDLELFKKEESSYELSGFTIKLTCTDHSKIETREVNFMIEAVNEFAPEFINTPLRKEIPESTPKGSEVIRLNTVAHDKDINVVTSELAAFAIHNFSQNEELDGRSYFTMANPQTGSIILTKALDYDTLQPANLSSLFLNVSVSDRQGWTTYTTLILLITDVDDLPPEFYDSDCPSKIGRSIPCFVPYHVTIPINYTGPLTDIKPAAIKARDMDVTANDLSFSVQPMPGQSRDEVKNISINNTTGELRLLYPFKEPTTVNLVVLAIEISPEARYTQAALEVRVGKQGSLPNGSRVKVSPTTNNNDSNTQSFIITLVIQGLAIAILLIVVVVLLCTRYRSRKRGAVTPTEASTPKHGVDKPATILRRARDNMGVQEKPQREDRVWVEDKQPLSEYTLSPDKQTVPKQDRYAVPMQPTSGDYMLSDERMQREIISNNAPENQPPPFSHLDDDGKMFSSSHTPTQAEMCGSSCITSAERSDTAMQRANQSPHTLVPRGAASVSHTLRERSERRASLESPYLKYTDKKQTFSNDQGNQSPSDADRACMVRPVAGHVADPGVSYTSIAKDTRSTSGMVEDYAETEDEYGDTVYVDTDYDLEQDQDDETLTSACAISGGSDVLTIMPEDLISTVGDGIEVLPSSQTFYSESSNPTGEVPLVRKDRGFVQDRSLESADLCLDPEIRGASPEILTKDGWCPARALYAHIGDGHHLLHKPPSRACSNVISGTPTHSPRLTRPATCGTGSRRRGRRKLAPLVTRGRPRRPQSVRGHEMPKEYPSDSRGFVSRTEDGSPGEAASSSPLSYRPGSTSDTQRRVRLDRSHLQPYMLLRQQQQMDQKNRKTKPLTQRAKHQEWTSEIPERPTDDDN